MKIVVTLFSLAILMFIAIGGIISSKKTDKDTFFSIEQTNWLRSIAILMIMFSHLYPLIGITYDDGIISFCLNFGYLGVAIFFLLSGYSLMISKINKPDYLKCFIPKRLVRLYVPFLIVFVFNVLLLVVMGQGVSVKDFLLMPLMSLPDTLNWYLKIQLGLYILFYILAKLIKNNNNVMIGTAFAICIIYMIIGYCVGITAFWYETVFAFPLGVFIAVKKDNLYMMLSKRYYIALPISVLLFCCSLLPYYLLGGTLLEILFILGFLQLVVCICAKFAGNILNKIFTFLGTIFLELYLTHTVINNTIISRINSEKQSFIIGVIILVVFIMVSIILSAFVKKISDIVSDKIINRNM